MKYFKLWMGDYMRDTGHLTHEEHGAYVLLLLHYYATKRPLPKGAFLFRMLGSQKKRERDSVTRVLERYWIETEAGWTNKRADKEIAEAKHQAVVNKITATNRTLRRRTPAFLNNGSLTDREPNHSHSHSHSQIEKILEGRDSDCMPDSLDEKAAQACLAMAEVGIPRENSSSNAPRLRRLIHNGVAIETFRDAAREAVASGSKFPFMSALKTAEASMGLSQGLDHSHTHNAPRNAATIGTDESQKIAPRLIADICESLGAKCKPPSK